MDLESAGNAAVAEAVRKFDQADDAEFVRLLRTCVRRRMIDEVKRLTHKGRGMPTGLPQDADGSQIAIRDAAADDPADLAVAAEYDLPTPAEVAIKATKLKLAVLDAVTPGDVRDIVRAQVRKAKAGRATAAKLVLSLVAGADVTG